VKLCPIAIQHRERPGCGNTASGSAWDWSLRPSRCPLLPLLCVHRIPRASRRKRYLGQSPNLQGFCEKPRAGALKLHRTSHELFLLGSWPPRHARIAITPATVHPAHGAAIAGVTIDKGRRTPFSLRLLAAKPRFPRHLLELGSRARAKEIERAPA
jgi:hypothetical protein